MAGPSAKKTSTLVAHPDDADDLRAAVEEAERGELLSPEESAAYVEALVAGEPAAK